MTEANRINLGVFPVKRKKAIQAIIRRTSLPLSIDSAPVDIHGKPVLYSVRVIAHCTADKLWPFWKEYEALCPTAHQFKVDLLDIKGTIGYNTGETE